MSQPSPFREPAATIVAFLRDIGIGARAGVVGVGAFLPGNANA
jgi:hypothetical protein